MKGRPHQVDPGHEGQVTFAEAQALAGQVSRDQGRRTRGVHNQTRPRESEDVREASGRGTQRGPCAGIGVHVILICRSQQGERMFKI